MKFYIEPAKQTDDEVPRIEPLHLTGVERVEHGLARFGDHKPFENLVEWKLDGGASLM